MASAGADDAVAEAAEGAAAIADAASPTHASTGASNATRRFNVPSFFWRRRHAAASVPKKSFADLRVKPMVQLFRHVRPQ